MSAKYKDMVGQKIDHLTVLRLHTEKTPGSRNVSWVCVCDCGQEIIKASNNLRRKKRQYLSCGCQRDNRKYRVGMVIGELTFQSYDAKTKNFTIICSCGNSFTTQSQYLHNKKSCGCRLYNIKDLSGQKFGSLTAQKIVGSDAKEGKMWLCVCDCGGTRVTTTHRLTRGLNKTCGCSGRLTKDLV